MARMLVALLTSDSQISKCLALLFQMINVIWLTTVQMMHSSQIVPLKRRELSKADVAGISGFLTFVSYGVRSKILWYLDKKPFH